MIKVTEEDFNVAEEYLALIDNNTQDGAVVFFVGLVRDFNQGHNIAGLYLEHYPAMTELALKKIVQQAKQRWPINQVRLVHRIGSLGVNEQIVFVGVSSPHRDSSFEATQFIMDYLKTEAPFWKKEITSNGERWVEAEHKDQQALKKWLAK